MSVEEHEQKELETKVTRKSSIARRLHISIYPWEAGLWDGLFNLALRL